MAVRLDSYIEVSKLLNITIPPNKSEPIRKTVGHDKFEMIFDRNSEIKNHPEIAYFTELSIRNNSAQVDLYLHYGRSQAADKIDIIAPGATITLPTAPDKIWLEGDGADCDITIYYDYYTADLIDFVRRVNKDVQKDALNEILPQINAIVRREFQSMMFSASEEDVKQFVKKFKLAPGGEQ